VNSIHDADRNLALELVRVTETAAIAAAPWVGRGEKNLADKAAVEAMREMINSVDMSGVVVIGEGEKDDAPMLHNGEEVGNGLGPKCDVAVDPIDGTSLTANGMNGAISVIALAPRGSMYDPSAVFYMNKIVTGPESSGVIDINAPVKVNIQAVETIDGDDYAIDDDDLTAGTDALVKYLMKENSEFKQMMMDQNKQMIELAKTAGHNNSHNTNTNNSHNKSFNLQFFLNETCKDAMNITDFVDSIKLQLSDLISMGDLGYVEGISNIITTKLKALDVTQRPVHCADKKREVIYVKDQDKWEKEDDEKKKIRRAITKIANKNYVLIPQFREKYPDYIKSSSPVSDQYNKIVIEAMGGSGDNDLEKQNKIIRNIAKVITIDKDEKIGLVN
jgi:hypothetical protein